MSVYELMYAKENSYCSVFFPPQSVTLSCDATRAAVWKDAEPGRTTKLSLSVSANVTLKIFFLFSSLILCEFIQPYQSVSVLCISPKHLYTHSLPILSFTACLVENSRLLVVSCLHPKLSLSSLYHGAVLLWLEQENQAWNEVSGEAASVFWGQKNQTPAQCCPECPRLTRDGAQSCSTARSSYFTVPVSVLFTSI